MSKLVLTLATTNRPTWGAREGIREALQNGRDATIEHGASLSVRYRKDTSTLVIENEGCTIPLMALFIGFSTKREDRRLAGHYGEGLPFGILALVRDGHSVKIRTGSEVWIARIEPHDQVRQDVLVFQIASGRKNENRVQFEIGNVSEETFNALPEHFLFLSKDKTDRIETDSGTLLLGEKYRGNVYVKGIFVCHDSKLNYGYDFSDAETDSERKMLASYQLETHCRYVWQKAAATRPDLMRKFIGLLQDQAKDLEGIEPWNTTYFSEEIKSAVAADFRDRHGEDAVPVRSLADSAEIEHLGKTGIIVPGPQRALLESVLGTTDQVKERLREEAQKLYGWHELSAEEKANLTRALDLVKVAANVSLDEIDVTNFRDEKIHGLFRDGRILLARKILLNRLETRKVLVHEVAHRNGGDGEKSHVSEIERIHAEIEEHLLVCAENQNEPR
jgi:hypothetical protein